VLDSEILGNFIESFFGYGNLAAPLWFIGMEEGGGNTAKEIQERLRTWNERGRRQIEDVAEFHCAFGKGELFLANAPIQRTWQRLIRTVFAVRGFPPNTEQMRQFQIASFARINSCVASLELLPLPSPRTSVWNYGPGQGDPPKPWTNLDYLQKRSDYRRHVLRNRIAGLRRMIQEHEPRAVLFYGDSYRRQWKLVCDLAFPKGERSLNGAGVTQYMLLPHPTPQYGASPDRYFDEAGRTLRECGVILDY
jgi:hypothetical protein